MQIELRSHAIDLSPETRLAIERRASFAFDRFDARIKRVVITLTDTNGPKGGAADECAVSIELRSGGRIFVRETHEEALTAGLRALDRAKEALSRSFGKRLDRASVRVRSPHGGLVSFRDEAVLDEAI